ncbi:MAG: MFS transporter, partial [Kangiellaceae bacterium]|nr:MFS transporter [Kangiellaceae bacterium]
MPSSSSPASQDGQQNNRSPFPRAFYVANTMEIFERLSWYGIYTFLAVYLTSSKGLGLAPNEQSLIMGIGSFLLYIVPVFAGAMADRFGYKTMFLLAFSILAPGYYLLGQADSFTSFFMVFLMVAIGGGMFKPVVTGTVGRSTDDTNRGLGFGIFYMMVNVGGALGPIVAQWIKGNLGWSWAFSMASIWIAINFIPAIFFYKDPLNNESNSDVNKTSDKKSIKQVLQEMQLVLGNGRLAFFVVPALTICCLKAGKIIGVNQLFIYLGILIGVNLIWSLLVKHSDQNPWYKQKIKLGNKPFVVYLLILSGFWTVYNQVFYSFPLYVQHYVDSSDLIESAEATGSEGFVNYLTGIDVDTLSQDLIDVANRIESPDQQTTEKQQQAYILLSELQIKVPKSEILAPLTSIQKATERADDIVDTLHTKYNSEIKLVEVRKILVDISNQFVVNQAITGEALEQAKTALDQAGITIPDAYFSSALINVKTATDTAKVYAVEWDKKYKQADPQTILVLEFIAIVLFQVLISNFIARWRALPILVAGTAILTLGMWIGGFSHMLVLGGFTAATSVVIFAIGE